MTDDATIDYLSTFITEAEHASFSPVGAVTASDTPTEITAARREYERQAIGKYEGIARTRGTRREAERDQERGNSR